MLISSYGLFWHKDDVFWGRQKKPGRLIGVKARAKKENPVDFRDQVGFYALYDESFQLVYFGQAGRGRDQTLFERLRGHTRDVRGARWNRFSWFGTKPVRNDGGLRAKKENIQGRQEVFLDQAEALVIAVAEPPNNLQGGRFGEADQYLQVRDCQNLGPSLEEMVSKIYQSTRET